MTPLATALSLFVSTPSAFAADAELSLDDLLDTQVSVASGSDMSIRESPGIITVFSRDDIARTGARDLADLLEMVPSFQVGFDVWAVSGIGVRGNWAHEGKILYLVDGHEFNERLYSTLPIGQRIAADQIERIEIIRGPGSAIYGGYAELAVVKITTIAGSERNVDEGTVMYGQLTDGPIGRAEAMATATSVGDDWRVAASVRAAYGTPTAATYTAVRGATVDLAEGKRRIYSASLDLTYRRSHLRAAFESYNLDDLDGYVIPWSEPRHSYHRGLYLGGDTEVRLGEGLRLLPTLRTKVQVPWAEVNEERPGANYEHYASMVRPGLSLDWDVTDDVEITSGVQYLYDHAVQGPNDSPRPDYDGSTWVDYHNGAAFVQMVARSAVTFTAGARADVNDTTGWAVVPRVAVSKAWARTHVKLLASRAFRSPAIANIQYSLEPLRPEFTSVLEAEAGVRPWQGAYLTGNAFWTRIDDTIVYSYEGGGDGYANEGVAGTMGGEADFRYDIERVGIRAGYSGYVAIPEADVAAYAVPDAPSAMLGMAQHKVVLAPSVVLVEGLSVAPTVKWMSQRWAIPQVVAGESVYGTLPASTVIDVYVRSVDQLVDGLEIGVGVADVLNADPPAIQPYDSWHAPQSRRGREVYARVTGRL